MQEIVGVMAPPPPPSHQTRAGARGTGFEQQRSSMASAMLQHSGSESTSANRAACSAAEPRNNEPVADPPLRSGDAGAGRQMETKRAYADIRSLLDCFQQVRLWPQPRLEAACMQRSRPLRPQNQPSLRRRPQCRE